MYITYLNTTNQTTLEDFLSIGIISEPTTQRYTYTKKNAIISEEFKNRILTKAKELAETPIDIEYHTFKIPKRTGGFRDICAPSDSLKFYLTKVTNFLQNTCKMLEHDSAYAYVKGRCIKDVKLKHKQNNSRWFLHLDLKDFFPSCNKTFIINQLNKLFPLACLKDNQIFQQHLSKIIDNCLFEGGLPQGSPCSPLLTNLIMLPIDFEINEKLKHFKHSHYVYTRYADDIEISNKYNFTYNKIINNVIKEILKDTPFKIKHEKTHYGNISGSNYSLGLILNKEGKISTGHEKRQKFRAALHQGYLLTNESEDAIIRAHQLLGLIAYNQNIDKDYTEYCILRYNTKFNINLIN